MLALNRRFRPREALAGVPLWSLVSVFIGFFMAYSAVVYDQWLIRYLAAGLSLGSFAFGTTLYIFKDWALFTESVVSNQADAAAKLAGSEDR